MLHCTPVCSLVVFCFHFLLLYVIRYFVMYHSFLFALHVLFVARIYHASWYACMLSCCVFFFIYIIRYLVMNLSFCSHYTCYLLHESTMLQYMHACSLVVFLYIIRYFCSVLHVSSVLLSVRIPRASCCTNTPCFIECMCALLLSFAYYFYCVMYHSFLFALDVLLAARIHHASLYACVLSTFFFGISSLIFVLFGITFFISVL